MYIYNVYIISHEWNILIKPPLSDPSRKCAAEQDERRATGAAAVGSRKMEKTYLMNLYNGDLMKLNQEILGYNWHIMGNSTIIGVLWGYQNLMGISELDGDICR